MELDQNLLHDRPREDRRRRGKGLVSDNGRIDPDHCRRSARPMDPTLSELRAAEMRITMIRNCTQKCTQDRIGNDFTWKNLTAESSKGAYTQGFHAGAG
jgi:hypothetical protein